MAIFQDAESRMRVYASFEYDVDCVAGNLELTDI